jgi:methyl-accepting chemotaxis protein
MSAPNTQNPARELKSRKKRLYRRLAVISAAAFVASVAIILYRPLFPANEQVDFVCSSLVIAADTLLPYMISAVVAAITVVAVLTVVPLGRTFDNLDMIRERIHALAGGDLSTRLHVSTDTPELKMLAADVNLTVSFLGDHVAQWKIINRQQWDILEHLRQSAAKGDPDAVLKYVERMQKNWERIAEIEEKLST